MAKALPMIIGAAAIIATGGAAIPAVAAAVGTISIAGATFSTLSVIAVGLSVVGSLAGVLLAAQPPKPKFADGSSSVKQAVPPRTRVYGRYRLAGAFIYYTSEDNGVLYTLVCHAAHEIALVEKHWLNDEVVTIDGTGAVTSGHYDDFPPSVTVRIVNWLGTAGQIITGLPAEWDDGPPINPVQTHKAHGLACSAVSYSDLSVENHPKVFPNGAPAYRATLRGAKVYGPGSTFGTESTYVWSDNAALVILDYLTRTEASVIGPVPVGFGIPASRINLASFNAAATVCNQAIPLKAGGTEPRWRACFAYDLTEDRKGVLSDLLDSCAGRLTQGPDGRLGLTVGEPNPVATVTITDSQILEYDLSSGKAAIERINEIRATYVSEAQDWAETEAGIQSDLAAIDRNGVESSAIKVRCSPSEGQTQRVARAVLLRSNPTWAGRVRGTLALLDAWGERWVRLNMAELDLDLVFEISGMTLDRTTMTVEMNVISYDDWFDWTIANEQDPAVVPVDPPPIPATPSPTGVIATVMHRQLDARTIVATAVVSWNAPPSASLVADGRYRIAGGVWQQVAVNPGELSFETPPLQDGLTYEAAARFRGPRGTVSPWVAVSPPFTALADPVAPGIPTGLTALVSGSAINLTATAPNEVRFAAIRFWRNSVNNPATATQISGQIFVAPNGVATYSDHPVAGDWYYFATSENWSGVQSAKTAGVLAELAPAAPVITTTAATIGQTNPTITGTAFAGSTVKVFANAVLNQTTTADGSGNWSVALAALGSGAQAITATATVAGNESTASGSVTLTVVWYDPAATAHADFKGVQGRLLGSTALLTAIFDTITTSATIVTNANGTLVPIAANVLPISDQGLEVWETRANRLTCRNAAPTDLTGVTASGDAAAVLSRVDDSATMVGGSILATVKTAGTLNGFVYLLDNTLGVADAFATISGTVAAVGACRGSVVYRGSAGRIEIGGATAVAFGASTPYVRVGGGRTAAATTELFRIAAPAGAKIWFILPQLENGAFDTAPIVTNAVGTTRAAPTITRTAGADFSATEGFFAFRAKVASALVGGSGIILGSLQTTIADGNFIQALTVTGFRGVTQIASVQSAGPTVSVTATNITTAVYGYKTNDFGFACNGSATVTDTSGALPTGTPAKITVSLTTAAPFNGIIEQVKWSATKPSNAVIQTKSGWTIL